MRTSGRLADRREHVPEVVRGGVGGGDGAGAGLDADGPVAVDALRRAFELDEPVSLDWGLAVDGLLRFLDLLVDAVQGAPGPVGLAGVVDVLVRCFDVGPAGHFWVKMWPCPKGVRVVPVIRMIGPDPSEAVPSIRP